MSHEFMCKGLSVLDHLLGVRFQCWMCSLEKGGSNTGDSLQWQLYEYMNDGE